MVYSEAMCFVMELGDDVLQLALLNTNLDHLNLVIRHR